MSFFSRTILGYGEWSESGYSPSYIYMMKAGVRTLYARFGDVFASACVAGLAAGVGLLVVRAIQ